MSKNTRARLSKAGSAVPMGWPPENLLSQKGEFQRKVVSDLHGPILDFMGRFAEFAGKLYGVKIDPAKARFYSPGFDNGMNITPHQFSEAFTAFQRLSRGGYGDLKPLPGIADAFKRIRKEGIQIEIWTWVPGVSDYDPDTKLAYGTGIAQHATYELLEKLGLVDDVRKSVRFIKPEAKVPTMAQEHIPLIIEDHPVTAVSAGMAYGHAAILVPEPFNKNLVAPGVLRLDDRADLADSVIEFFNVLEKAGSLLGERR